MRVLSKEEMETDVVTLDYLDVDSEDGPQIFFEATIQELADLRVETYCGNHGNQPFALLSQKGYGKRKCRGSMVLAPNPEGRGLMVGGMFFIKIQTDKTAEKIEKIVNDAGGSFRYDDGECGWEGYKQFEIE